MSVMAEVGYAMLLIIDVIFRRSFEVSCHK